MQPSERLQSLSREAVFIILLFLISQNYNGHAGVGMTVTWVELHYLRFLAKPDGETPANFLKSREK